MCLTVAMGCINSKLNVQWVSFHWSGKPEKNDTAVLAKLSSRPERWPREAINEGVTSVPVFRVCFHCCGKFHHCGEGIQEVFWQSYRILLCFHFTKPFSLTPKLWSKRILNIVKSRNKEEGTWQLLGVAEKEAYYRYVEDHRQRQGHLGASRAVMTLSPVRRDGRGNGEEERREPDAAARRPKRPR